MYAMSWRERRSSTLCVCECVCACECMRACDGVCKYTLYMYAWRGTNNYYNNNNTKRLTSTLSMLNCAVVIEHHTATSLPLECTYCTKASVTTSGMAHKSTPSMPASKEFLVHCMPSAAVKHLRTWKHLN